MLGKEKVTDLSPRACKILLLVNVVLLVAAIVLAILFFCYQETFFGFAMVFVVVLTLFNTYGFVKRLRQLQP